MLNLASLLLGLSAWALGFLAIGWKRAYALSVGSMSCCALSLVIQIFEIRRRVAAEDLAGLMDTVPALSTVAAVLLAGSVLLNLAAWIRNRRI